MTRLASARHPGENISRGFGASVMFSTVMCGAAVYHENDDKPMVILDDKGQHVKMSINHFVYLEPK